MTEAEVDDKRITLEEAVRLVSDGDGLFCGGFGYQRPPIAFAHELVRQKKRNLTRVVSYFIILHDFNINCHLYLFTHPYLDSSGTIQGFDADLARYLGKSLFNDPAGAELVPVTSGGRIPFLYSGWIDTIIASLTATEDRRQVLEFSTPYFTSGSLLLVPKDSPIQGLQDLAGKTVAVLAGSVQEKDLAQIAPDARRVTFEKLPEAIAALKQKRAEALAQDDLFVLAAAKANPSPIP